MHHPMPFGKVPVSCCRTFLWHLPGARMQAGAPAGRLPSTLSFANVGNIWEYNSPMSKLSTIYKQQNLLAAFLGWNVESILPPLARLTRAWLATHSPGKVINTSCYDSYNCSHKAAATIEFSPLRTCCFACSLNFLCVCVSSCVLFLLKQLSPRTQTDTLQNNQEHPRAVSRAGVFAKIHEQLVTCCFWSSWAEYLWCLDGNKQPSLE